MGGFFTRELGGGGGGDVQTACFAAGLRDKGSVSLAQAGQVRHMYVDGQDTRTGLCTAYAGESR